MTTTVIKTVGSASRNYSDFDTWNDAAPSNLTTTRANTTQAGSTSSNIVLDAAANNTPDFYKFHAVWCDARPTEKRLITAYDGTTKIATIGALNGSNATWDNTPGIEAFTVDKTIWKAECYDDSEFSTRTTMPALTTDASNYLWLTCAAGKSFNDKGAALNHLRYDTTNGVSYKYTGHNAVAMDFNVNNVLVEGLQCSFQMGNNPFSLQNTQNTIFKKCYLETTLNNSIQNPNNIGPEFDNCAIVNRVATLSVNFIQGNVKCYNCTIFRPTDLSTGGTAIINYYGGYPLIKNTVVLGSFTTMFGGTLGSYQSGTGYNASSVGTGSMPGSNNVGSLTASNELVGVSDTSRDLIAKSGNSLQAGLTDSAHTGDVDIVGKTRAGTPTIGCWEFIAASTSFLKSLFVTQAVNRAATY